MTNRRLLLVAVLGLLGVSLLAALFVQPEGAAGSALSPTARGWLAARRYAEARGTRVRLMDREDYPLAAKDVLWIVFPWQQLSWEEPARRAREQLGRGGTLVVAYSGREGTLQEEQFLQELGLTQLPRHEPEPPLHPLRWREERRTEWRLFPVEAGRAKGGEPAGAGRIRRSEWLPRWPSGTEAWLRNERDEVIAGEIAQHHGRLILLPSELLCNARLETTGNADVLERLVQRTSSSWVFDEYHHGLDLAPTAGETRPTRAFELWMAHLALVYLLTILALMRRFGPAWSDPPVSTGSARAFFLRIGALHARLAHEREAARVLYSRARELSPGLDLTAPDEAGTGGDTFLRFARLLARAQQRRSR